MPNQTSNMGLKIPINGENDYPTSVSNSFTLVDAHDHSNGKGTPVGTGGIADAAVTAAKLAADSVTTAKILDANVTRAKQAAVGEQVSSSTGNFFTSSTSPVDVTNATVSITTTGRPVVLMLVPDGAAQGSISLQDLTTRGSGFIYLKDSSTTLQLFFMETPSDSGQLAVHFPPGMISTFVTGLAAGAHTLKLQASVGAGTTSFNITNCKLIAFEL